MHSLSLQLSACFRANHDDTDDDCYHDVGGDGTEKCGRCSEDMMEDESSDLTAPNELVCTRKVA